MEFIDNKKYDIFVRVDHANKNNKIVNLTVTLSDLTVENLKVTEAQANDIVMGNVYNMNVTCSDNGTRKKLIVNSFSDVLTLPLNKELEEALRVFYTCANTSLVDLKTKLEQYIASIKNKILKDITLSLYNDNKVKVNIYPAGTRMHHAYLGGLMFHTVTMLELADKYLEIFKTLNKDLVYSGIILHDLMKVEEFNSPVNTVSTDYSLEGQLLGHLVMGAVVIDRKAIELNCSNAEEVLLLKHLIISHHGQLAFGSPKKPLTQEALLISSLDAIDSKLRVLEEELVNTEVGTFTNNIPVLERSKFYKSKI